MGVTEAEGGGGQGGRETLCSPGIMCSQAWEEPDAFSKQPINFPSVHRFALGSNDPFPGLD